MDKQYNEFHKNSKIQGKPIKRNNFTYRLIISELEKVLQKVKKKKVEILDYGCGVGTVDFYLASKGCNVLGIDISKDAIHICRESAHAIGVSKRTRFEVLNTKVKSTFDIIICSEVIEHVPNDIDLLKKLSKYLKKNGYLIVTTPSVNAPLFRLGLATNFDRRVGHLRRYDPNSLIKQIKSLGYKIIFLKQKEGILRNSLYIFPFLGWAIKLLKGPFSDIVTVMDDFLVRLFGESNIIILAQKI